MKKLIALVFLAGFLSVQIAPVMAVSSSISTIENGGGDDAKAKKKDKKKEKSDSCCQKDANAEKSCCKADDKADKAEKADKADKK